MIQSLKSREDRYGISPWNHTLSSLFTKARNLGLLDSVKPFEKCKEADRDHYCSYHVNLGHHTNDCHELLDAIQKLVKDGHIKDLTLRPNTMKNPLPKLGGRVNMISACPTKEQIVECSENPVTGINRGSDQDAIFDLIRKANPTSSLDQANVS